MAIELAKAYVQIIPSAEGISSKIAEELEGPAEESGKSAGKKAGSGFMASVGSAITSGASAVLNAGATVFKGVADGAAAMVKGIVEGAKATSDYGSNVLDMSEKIGISTEGYQKWKYVMEQSNVSVDILQTSMKTLSNAAVNGSDAFKKLGISEEELATLSSEDLFGRVVEGLSGMEAGTQRTALASSLLGKAATELNPILNQGTDAIFEQMNMAEQYGMVMSEEAIMAADAFGDSVTTMQNTFTGMKNQLFSEFLPSMTQVTDGIALLMSGSDEGMDMVAEGVGEFVGKIASAAPELLEIVEAILPQILTQVVSFLPQMLDAGILLFTSLIAELPTITIQITSQLPFLIQSITGKFSELTYLIVDAGIQLFVALIQNLPQIIVEIVKAIPQIIKSIVSAFKDNWGQMKQAGLDLIKGLWQGINDAASWLWNLVRGWCNNLVGKIKGFFGIHSPSTVFAGIGDNMMLGLAGGIEDGADGVYSAIDRVTAATMGNINGSMTVNSAISMPEYTASSRMNDIMTKLDNLKIYLDGDTLVGGIARRMDGALGIQSGLAERGLA